MQKNNNKYNMSIIYGICIGTTLGIVFDHTILGMALGLGIGVFIVSVIVNKSKEQK